MLRRNIQTFIWKYDKYLTTIVALLPASLQIYSSRLGRITLPSIWSVIVLVTSLINLLIGYRELAVIGFITIACIPVGTVLKLIVRRSRPKTIYAENMKVKSYSFPSSHTYSATIAGGYLALLGFVLLQPPISLLVGGLCTTLIAVIGISRIHVGAHYPTDVTAGWILGASVLYAITQINL